MKQFLIVGLLSFAVVSCNDTDSQTIEEPTEQEVTPGAELGNEPMATPEAPMTEESSTEHFDAALISLDESQPAAAADHMQMAISALETESVSIQDSARTELKTVIERLDDITDRLRTGEATDRAEVEQLITRAETLVTEQQ